MVRNKKLVILYTSDVHGHISVQSFKDKEKIEDFSLSRIKTYVDSVREKEENVIFIDNGDTIQGSPLTNFYKEKNDNKNLMEAYNLLGIDGWVLGNHDFNYGKEYLRKAIKNIKCPVISGNIIDKSEKDKLGNVPYIIKNLNGLKIGILGLTTQYIPHWENEKNIKGLEFLSAVECGKKYIPILKKEENCDLIILSYHGGFEKELKTGEALENLTGENEGYSLLSNGLDIDVLLTGHQHRHISENINNIPVLQPGYGGSHLGRVDLELDENNEIISINQELVEVKDFEEDFQMEKLVEEDMKEVQKILDKKAGEIYPSARITDVIKAQAEGHPYLDLINEIQMAYGNTDISAVAIYKEDANGLGKEVTMRDIMRNYPYNNTLTKIKITGKELREILEYNSRYFILDEEENLVVNPEYKYPKNTIYNYDIYSGIDYCYDYKKPVGKRVVRLKYHDKDLKDDDEIIFSINSYRGKGGGDFPVLDGTQIIWESNEEMPQMIYNYINKKKKIKIKDLPSVETKGYKKIKKE